MERVKRKRGQREGKERRGEMTYLLCTVGGGGAEASSNWGYAC